MNQHIHTSCGDLIGNHYGDYIEYRGIPYATAKRFEYPVSIDSWEGTYDATEYKACAFQRRSFEDDAVCNQFYHKEFRANSSFTYSEDCFYLNIWSPIEPVDCPVLIYIHGGSFTGGSSNEGHISGIEFAKNNVIFVSFNYRLGPFGFCSHPDLTTKDGVCGNFGLFDQYEAIRWVRNHIADFGGNPNQITLMGQSAGAMSVDIHCSSPLEQNWYQGAVLSSGAGLQRFFLKPRVPSKTKKFWEQVMKNANVTTMEELKTVEPKVLYYAWDDACKASKLSMACTLPVYDGKLLTKESFRKNAIADIPYLIGMTITDMTPPILLRFVKKWAAIAEKQNRTPCFTYLFSRNLPGDDAGAWHSSDLLYFFTTLKNNWRPFEEIDFQISHQMSQALTSFVKNANPNCDCIPNWEADAKRPMSFSEHTKQLPWKETPVQKQRFGGKREW